MRALTGTEKKICYALQKHHTRTPPVLIGDVLCELFDIECIKKSTLGEYDNYPYKCTLTVVEERRDEVVKNLNEAIAFIRILEEKGMLYLSSNSIDNPIGQAESMARLISEPKVTISSMRDLVCDNSWDLLNSYYFLTNGFDDYVKYKFKTIETRRHRVMVGIAIASIIVAVLIALSSVWLNICHNHIKLDSKQYEQIIELLQENNVQMSNQTTNIIDEIDKEIKSLTDSVVSTVTETPRVPVR